MQLAFISSCCLGPLAFLPVNALQHEPCRHRTFSCWGQRYSLGKAGEMGLWGGHRGWIGRGLHPLLLTLKTEEADHKPRSMAVL